MSDKLGDKAEVIIEENIVLEKFEGDGDVLVERVHLTNGIITKTEKFKDGELVK